VRIDRADLADEPGDAHTGRRARSAPDDPAAVGKGRGKAVGSDGLPDSSPAPLASTLRIERATAYRAAVDAAYRQYATYHGYARVQEPEDFPRQCPGDEHLGAFPRLS
jgi:hypothetical protein